MVVVVDVVVVVCCCFLRWLTKRTVCVNMLLRFHCAEALDGKELSSRAPKTGAQLQTTWRSAKNTAFQSEKITTATA